MRPPIPKHCPPPFAKLIADCWSPQAAKRPSFAQILTALKEIKASGVVPGAPPKRGAAELAAAAAAAKAEAMAKAEAEAAAERGASASASPAASLAMPSAELDVREVVFGPPTGSGLTPDHVDCRWRGTALCARQWAAPAPGSLSLAGARAPAMFQLPPPIVAIVERFALLRHPNVQLFMGAVALRKPAGAIACVFEDAGRGTLAHVLASRSAALSVETSSSSLASPSSAAADSNAAAAAAASAIFDWETSTRLALDIACGLAFLHGARPPVFQPRLSAHSVWLDAGGRAKLAGVFEAELEALCGAPTACAPPSLAAPETMSASSASASASAGGNTFSTLSAAASAAATDVFHLGTLMWEIFAGGNALSAACDSAAEGGAKQPPMTRIPPDVQALIRACWHEAPAKRPSLADVTARLEAFLKDGPSRVVLGAQNARRYHKKRTVLAFRSTDAVAIQKKWGKSQGKEGCFVVTGDDHLELGHAADVYCIDAATFAATYERVGGADSHRYRKTGHIWASRSPHALAVRTQAGTVELAAAGDYLVQDDAGAQWAIQADAFEQLYEASP